MDCKSTTTEIKDSIKHLYVLCLNKYIFLCILTSTDEYFCFGDNFYFQTSLVCKQYCVWWWMCRLCVATYRLENTSVKRLSKDIRITPATVLNYYSGHYFIFSLQTHTGRYCISTGSVIWTMQREGLGLG